MNSSSGARKREPVAELDPRFSSERATPTPWSEAREHLEGAEAYWLSTVRPDARPHVTPLMSVCLDDVLYFCTGPTERKAENLAENSHCILTTGCNSLGEGLDLVVEGDATRVRDDAELQRVADAYEAKYGSEWHYEVRNGAFQHRPGEAWVFEVAPVTVFGFGKGEVGSQTRWRFSEGPPH
jgi:nitroimidazol reductase NimA-like FMN-containing flavoprotein (pyridoxamine 5'-phosphate oxidase superfamily)